jgi:hypothetical protein
MAAARDISSAPSARKRGRPATTPEEREKLLQSKAFDLAEKQLDSGNASSQIISMLIKGGGVREQLEALNAFRSYTGESSEEDFD